INFLKEELNFANSKFFIKKKSGKSTFGTERYFKLVEETEDKVIIPRGFIGKQITIATIQSLPKQIEQIQNQFGTILVDECHHIPAETFRSAIEKLNTFYLYGLTATPFRKYNDDKLIFVFLGEIISEIA